MFHPALAARFSRNARAEVLNIITVMGRDGIEGGVLAAHVAPYLHLTSLLPILDRLVRDGAVMRAGRRLFAC
ncbi:MAG TPA: hypothetical protein VI197_30180 [Polyangiaceae bacterium]